MKNYELAVVYNPNLDEEALNAEKASVNALIERFGGTVDKIDDWGKRRLAYEIQKVNEGVYNFVSFSAEATAPAEIEARMRIKENVLRYLVISVEE
ncbi:MAG TPA: 30S ribosomal protein S6 [Lachnospiraceae bacterium]|nr:30S ribosomal protein S6 [Lachnospiraceae bacterium]